MAETPKVQDQTPAPTETTQDVVAASDTTLPGGVYIVNGVKVDANGVPIKDAK